MQLQWWKTKCALKQPHSTLLPREPNYFPDINPFIPLQQWHKATTKWWPNHQEQFGAQWVAQPQPRQFLAATETILKLNASYHFVKLLFLMPKPKKIQPWITQNLLAQCKGWRIMAPSVFRLHAYKPCFEYAILSGTRYKKIPLEMKP